MELYGIFFDEFQEDAKHLTKNVWNAFINKIETLKSSHIFLKTFLRVSLKLLFKCYLLSFDNNFLPEYCLSFQDFLGIKNAYFKNNCNLLLNFKYELLKIHTLLGKLYKIQNHTITFPGNYFFLYILNENRRKHASVHNMSK